MTRPVRIAGALGAAVLLGGCPGPPQPSPPNAAAGADPFTDVTAAAGIRFRHENGGRPPLNILQTAGSGCAFLDYDGDGRLDLFLVNGRFLDSRPESGQPHHALYRNRGDGTFEDVTERAGVGGSLYGMGVAVADYDGDGRPDLYVTGFGRNTLYRNRGDRTFADMTGHAGVGGGGWSTAAAWADADGDGDLDLFVGRYLQFGPGSRQLCDKSGIALACPPRYYPGESGLFYRNNGNGTFTECAAKVGLGSPEAKTLGCLWTDFDGDGRPDLVVANDGVPRSLYRNLGTGSGGLRFEDVALQQGMAYDERGNAQASMGVDAADWDRDGDFDLFFTNFQNESDALFRRDRFGYVAASQEAGLAAPTLPFLTFGTGFLDWDGDGTLDLMSVCGHVQDAVARVDPSCTFAQRRQLWRGRGDGTFEEIGGTAGPALTAPAVGRGLAFGDWDNDGDVDALVSNNGGPPMLLRNEVGNRRHWLRLRLQGRAPNRFAIGARVEVIAGNRRQVTEVRAGSSYGSTHDPRSLFGLRDAAGPVTLRIRWPDGRVTERKGVPMDQEVEMKEPSRG